MDEKNKENLPSVVDTTRALQNGQIQLGTEFGGNSLFCISAEKGFSQCTRWQELGLILDAYDNDGGFSHFTTRIGETSPL